MEKKISDLVNNALTTAGGVLLGLAIVNEIASCSVPELEKLTSEKDMNKLQLLTVGEEKKEADTSEHDTESKKKDDEITELKKKLAELESKSDVQSQQ